VTRCDHARRAFTIGGPEDSDGYVWCPDCRTNLTVEADEWFEQVRRDYYRHARPLPRPGADWDALVGWLAVLAAIALVAALIWG
jgi:hypothetical protein